MSLTCLLYTRNRWFAHDMDGWARGKRRGFSHGAAPRHSQSARLKTDFLRKRLFFSGKKNRIERKKKRIWNLNTDLGLSTCIGPLEIIDTFSRALARIDWFWLPIFRTNLVRGLSNKVMKFQKKGAVLVQIAPLLISQLRNQNQSIGTTMTLSRWVDKDFVSMIWQSLYLIDL